MKRNQSTRTVELYSLLSSAFWLGLFIPSSYTEFCISSDTALVFFLIYDFCYLWKEAVGKFTAFVRQTHCNFSTQNFTH